MGVRMRRRESAGWSRLTVCREESGSATSRGHPSQFFDRLAIVSANYVLMMSGLNILYGAIL